MTLRTRLGSGGIDLSSYPLGEGFLDMKMSPESSFLLDTQTKSFNYSHGGSYGTPQRRGSGKLFVGGLSHETDDTTLRLFFENFGQVRGAEVLRDHQTLNSRGFGFVTFEEDTTAQKVLKLGQLTPHIIDGKQVEVKVAVPKNKDSLSPRRASNEWSEPSLGDPGVSLQYQGSSGPPGFPTPVEAEIDTNFPLDVALHRAHSDGDIRVGNAWHGGQDPSFGGNFTNDYLLSESREKEVLPRFNSSRGMFRLGKERSPTSVSSYSSVSMNSNPNLPGTPLQRAGSLPSMQRPSSLCCSSGYLDASQGSSEGQVIPNKIFVGGLLYATGHESLRKYFACFGEVETAEVIYNRETKKSRGFGFVIFQNSDAVERVFFEQKVRCLAIDGKQIEVKRCKARENSFSDAYLSAERSELHRMKYLSRSVSLNVNEMTEKLYNLGFETEPSSPLSELNRASSVYLPKQDYPNVYKWPKGTSRIPEDDTRYDNFDFEYGFRNTLSSIAESHRQ